ncbi:MAG: DNA repair protein RecN, partial [Treponemataceae bacterium]
KFLDSYAGIVPQVEAFTKLYNSLLEKRKLLEQMNTSDSERLQKIDLLSFAIEEINSANLNPKEEDELIAEESRLNQYEKLYADIETISEIVQGDQSNVLATFKKIRSIFEHASSLDSSLQSCANRFDSLFYELSDINDEVRSYKQSLVFDPTRLEAVQDRLATIFKLKKKYCANPNSSISDILLYGENSTKQLEQLKAWEGNKAELVNEVSDLEKNVYLTARDISQKRKNASEKMASQIEIVLADLGMKGTQFAVNLTVKDGDQSTQKCGQYGLDNIEFLISANPGSPLKPLSKIASGGELSRIMLAIKTILADSDEAGTLIFDEIDTGIGGEIAISVGKHLKMLSKYRQVFCITHLANIASFADTHIKIEKSVDNGQTTTTLYPIDSSNRVVEIARMLSGDADSQQSLEHARLLLQKFGE